MCADDFESNEEHGVGYTVLYVPGNKPLGVYDTSLSHRPRGGFVCLAKTAEFASERARQRM